jgi:nucleoside-diphosphate-sugar epimerase
LDPPGLLSVKIFVTGGTGFIGSPAVRELARRGHELLVFSADEGSGKGPLPDHSRFVQGDLRDHKDVGRVMRDFGAEALVHLAWEGLPDYSEDMCERNLIYSINLFREAADAGCSLLLSTGSCWEYLGRSGMLNEDDQLGGVSVFSAVKNALRLIGEAISRKRRASFYWLRLFFAYGPGQRSQSLIPYIIRSVKSNQSPVIQTPYARNDFIFVEDVASAVADVIDHRPGGVVYNVGSGMPVSVEAVIRAVYEQVDKPVDEEIFKERRSESGDNFWGDISRISVDTGWRPKHDIAAGIRATVESLRGED